MGDKGSKEEPKYRRMFITMENYQKHDLDHEAIQKAIRSFASLVYGCFDLEVSSNGVPHAHAYLVFSDQVRVSTAKNVFGDFIHIDKAQGSHAQCIAYCEKSGEAFAEKKKTQVEGSFWETGERPQSGSEKRKGVWASVYAMAKTGEFSALDILEVHPSLANHLEKIEILVARCKEQKSKKQWRDVRVYLLHGDTATGKTTWAYENHGEGGIYRVTDYEHPYEGYAGERNIVYDEFDHRAHTMNLSSILQLTDRFPLGAALTRRYSNLVPEFKTIIFISNESPDAMYKKASPKQWNAFLRRIDHIYRFDGIGLIVEENKTQYQR